MLRGGVAASSRACAGAAAAAVCARGRGEGGDGVRDRGRVRADKMAGRDGHRPSLRGQGKAPLDRVEQAWAGFG
jgi:hypothetical protein